MYYEFYVKSNKKINNYNIFNKIQKILKSKFKNGELQKTKKY